MKNTAILVPLFALAAWTGCMLLLTAFRRVRAGMQGKIRVKVFRLGESPEVPDELVLPNRNYMNLLELPVLFYVVCLMAYAAQQMQAVAVALAWAYVALRVVHSVIHITYNNILHRFAAFAASNFALLGLWLVVGSAVLAGTAV